MTPFIGLLGTLLGGLIACLGIFLTHRIQESRERKRWLREKKEEAFSCASRSLLKLRNTRSRVTAKGTTLLDVRDMKGWFDEYNESLFWISQISLYSPDAYGAFVIGEKTDKLRNWMEELFTGKSRFVKEQDAESILQAYGLGQPEREQKSGFGLGLYMVREIVTSTQPPEKPSQDDVSTETVFMPQLIQDLLDAILAAARSEIGMLGSDAGTVSSRSAAPAAAKKA